MIKLQIYSRRDDMSADGTLNLMMQRDGDIIVSIFHGGAREGYIEFCACGAGGGRSPNTRKALEALAEAMDTDNKSNPHCAVTQSFPTEP